MAKVAVYHFHNGSGGGVLSVIQNLLLYRQQSEIQNHVIYTINKEQTPNFFKPALEGAVSEQVFFYSPKWNFYYTCRQLAKLLPDKKAVIVAHDWLELGMVSHLGLKNPVIFFVHGDYDYYYQLAAKHCDSIDTFICVCESISKKLIEILPSKFEEITYSRFPVPSISKASFSLNKILQIIFVGRCEDAKGYNLLPEIEKKLRIKKVKVNWHIVGEGSEDVSNQSLWPKDTIICFNGKLTQVQVFRLLGKSDLFLLPSFAEGMPVSVIEAMKAGVVPIVNNVPGGIQELVINGKTGYKIEKNLLDDFVAAIKQLNDDRGLLKAISEKASLVANCLFDPLINTRKIEVILLRSVETKKIKRQFKAYGSRLDQKYIPNFLVYILRSVFISLNKQNLFFAKLLIK
jgi:glycosyltransferase involved in cell wall biosynthesis